MRIVIAGGTGQLGQILARAMVARGHEVAVMGRTPVDGAGVFVPWDGATVGA